MATTDKPLVNRVSASSLITINLEDYFPRNPIVDFDLKDFLFHGLILKEKDFRAALKAHNWEEYQGKYLAVFCSADAIIPTWAYMLVAAHAQPFAEQIFMGTSEVFVEKHYGLVLDAMDFAHLKGKRVVIKGCSNKPVPPSAYVDLTGKLQPLAQSIMYGEPCSTVPIFKRPREI
jgi:hypothetical protein